MATTRESIARLALQNIGVSAKIVSISSPASLEEKTIAAIYETTRDYVLSDFPWPFAKEYIELGDVEGDSGDPVNSDWTFAYAIPQGCMTVRRIVPQEGRRSTRKIAFEIGRFSNQRVIFTDEADAVAEITIAIIDENLFDDHFVCAFAWRIAAQIAPALSKIKDAASACYQMYEVEKSRAEVRAENEKQPDPEPDSELIRARGGGANGPAGASGPQFYPSGFTV